MGSGYKGLHDKLSGVDGRFIGEVISRLDRLRGKMPPFPGERNREEGAYRIHNG